MFFEKPKPCQRGPNLYYLYPKKYNLRCIFKVYSNIDVQILMFMTSKRYIIKIYFKINLEIFIWFRTFFVNLFDFVHMDVFLDIVKLVKFKIL
jgi:hypothetical protein